MSSRALVSVSSDTKNSEFQPLTINMETGRNKKKGKRCRRMCSKITENCHRCSQQCIIRYPLHHAARLGKFEELKLILDNPKCPHSVKERDECHGRTALHYAAATGNVEKGLMGVKVLLQCDQLVKSKDAAEQIEDLVNTIDSKGQTALHLAAINEATQIVIELLTNQADVDIRSADGKIPLSLIYKKTPNAMDEVLNQSISYVENCDCEETDSSDGSLYNFTDACVNVCLDFGPVIGYDDMSMGNINNSTEDASERKCPLRQETNFLYQVNRKRMASGARRQILSNVLVQAFLHFKWEKIKWFCYIAIISHILWLWIYIWTSIYIYVIACPFALNSSEIVELESENIAEFSTANFNQTGGQFCHLNPAVNMLLFIIVAVSSGIAIKELFQFCRLRTLYIRFENIGQCILLGFIFTSAPRISLETHSKLTPLDYQISAFGIFLAWTLTLCQFAKLPRIKYHFEIFKRKFFLKLPDHGVYVEILSRVFKKFLVFITIFSSLLVAFALSFSILMPEKKEFSTFAPTMVKILTMMTGELNYDDIFNAENHLTFHTASILMYLIFVVIATIILFNLLIGFTVSDIQGLQKDAQINQISSKLEQIFLMESFLLSSVTQRFVGALGNLTGSNHLSSLLNIIMVVPGGFNNLCYHTNIRQLPCQHRVKIRDLASKNCMAISDISGVVRSKIIQKRAFSTTSYTSFDSEQSQPRPPSPIAE